MRLVLINNAVEILINLVVVEVWESHQIHQPLSLPYLRRRTSIFGNSDEVDAEFFFWIMIACIFNSDHRNKLVGVLVKSQGLFIENTYFVISLFCQVKWDYKALLLNVCQDVWVYDTDRLACELRLNSLDLNLESLERWKNNLLVEKVHQMDLEDQGRFSGSDLGNICCEIALR